MHTELYYSGYWCNLAFLGQGDGKPKFKSYEEYDDWRSRQTINLAKLDAERPVYIAETKRPGIGITGYLVLAAAGIACVLFFAASGREILGGIMDFFSRFVR